MNEQPAVSVVMSVHDGERHLAAAIDSVLAQTFRNLELIVIDDGSTDSSPAILAGYAAGDERVRVYHQENVGLAVALNRAVSYARTPLIARLDADDIARQCRLELQLAHLAEKPEVGVLGGAVSFIDEGGREFAETRYPATDAEIRQAFPVTTPFVHSAVTMRREHFEAVGGYRPALPHAEDLDLWLRLSALTQLANLSETVVLYRIHPQQSTVRELEQQSISVLGAKVAWRAREAGLPDPFAETPLVDRAALRAAGASADDLTAEFVRLAVWLAKTLSRSGNDHDADELFAAAESRARSESGSALLVSFVRRERARRLRAQGRRLAAATLGLSAALVAARDRVGRG
jgi:glycosyltransferase involved in cell wall biosynthesis